MCGQNTEFLDITTSGTYILDNPYEKVRVDSSFLLRFTLFKSTKMEYHFLQQNAVSHERYKNLRAFHK
jgi:hypothetical protein